MPKPPHLLLAAANVRELQSNLAKILDASGRDAIQAEIHANVSQLYGLGRAHYLFAARQGNRDWRQKVSRLYYGAYNVSRAIRLCDSGVYSMDSSDHKKIEDLPADFPNKSSYSNRLRALRADRNLCDYDHVIRRRDLALGIVDSTQMVGSFLDDAKKYLRKQGIPI